MRIVVGVNGSLAVRPSVRAYLLTINPLVNFDRWLLANFLYWASLFIGAIVAFVVAALA